MQKFIGFIITWVLFEIGDICIRLKIKTEMMTKKELKQGNWVKYDWQ